MPRLKLRICFAAFLVQTFLILPLSLASAGSLNFDPSSCSPPITEAWYGKEVTYRACLDIVYVKNPVDTDYQKMNVYIPELYYQGWKINGYTAKNAPIFMPNQVGGYNPGEPATEGRESVRYALSKGYVVAAPGARGKTQDYGRAPAGIVDLKAAVRYLRYNDAVMPGDAEKIISNGTSAGGAMSSLLGATGNNSDYEPYLGEIGAANARDDIFAASCYCPITNLNNADMAYEWLFNREHIWNWFLGPTPLTDEQIVLSDLLNAMFPAYLNRLGLRAYEPRNAKGRGLKKAYGQIKKGPLLTLDEYGEGNFNDYAKSFIYASAQENLDEKGGLTVPRYGPNLPDYMNECKASNFDFITIEHGEVLDVDLAGYAACVTRMKPVPAFDSVDLSGGGTWENILFGTEMIPSQHFTRFSLERDINGDDFMADAQIIKMMSPMDYIGTKGSTTARYWRIRHGAADRDTSIAIPIILATKLMNEEFDVDFAMPWGVPHGGDYDLDELFAWIEDVCDSHHPHKK
jgi:hypothetical protein